MTRLFSSHGMFLAPLLKINWCKRKGSFQDSSTIPLIYMSVLLPGLFCFHYCTFIVSFEIRKFESFNFVLFQDCSGDAGWWGTFCDICTCASLWTYILLLIWWATSKQVVDIMKIHLKLSHVYLLRIRAFYRITSTSFKMITSIVHTYVSPVVLYSSWKFFPYAPVQGHTWHLMVTSL